MISIIAAVAKNNCIGMGGRLPWHIPEDMKHFKQLTMDKTVLMGRKTWESIPEKFRPLPGRRNIIITRNSDYSLPAGVEVYFGLPAALAAHAAEDVFVIGGEKIYRQTIDQAKRLYITQVDQVVEGDVFFPEIDQNMWQESEREQHDGFAFVTYARR